MVEIVRFPRPEEEDAPTAQRPSADVRIIPTIDVSSLKGADAQAAARALLPLLAVGEPSTVAMHWWRTHVDRITKQAKKIYTDAAVDRMVKGYTAAVRAEIARLRAEAEGR